MKKIPLFYKITALILAFCLLFPSSPISVFSARADEQTSVVDDIVDTEDIQDTDSSETDEIESVAIDFDEEESDNEELDTFETDETNVNESKTDETETNESETDESETDETETDETETDETESNENSLIHDGEDVMASLYSMDVSDFATTGSNDPWSVKLDGGKTMFGDKYVIPNTNTNVANAFTLYLEAGLEDEEKKDIKVSAPDETYVAFLIDQSYAMRDNGNGESLNAGLDSYFNAMKNENQKRLQNARAGLYSDIDPEGDVDAQMEDHLLKVILSIGYYDYDYVRYKDLDGLAILTDADVSYMLARTQVNMGDSTNGLDGDCGEKMVGYWGDARIGTGMNAMYNQLKELSQEQLDKTYLVIGSMFESHDYVTYENIPKKLEERFGYGNYNNYWYVLALITNIYIDGAPIMGPMDAKDDTDVGVFHYAYSANQINMALYNARLIKALGIKTHVMVVNSCYQHDIIETALASGDIGDLSPVYWGGIVGMTASLVSSDYPVNTDFATAGGWADYTDYDPPFESSGIASSFSRPASYDPYPGYFTPEDLISFLHITDEQLIWLNNHKVNIYGNGAQYYLDLNRYVETTPGTGDAGPDRSWQVRGVLYDYEDGHYPNKFGTYTKFPYDIDEIIPQSIEILQQQAGSTEGGYAGFSSVIEDQITDVFTVPNGKEDIRVYKVPRVPSDLDDNGIPASIDENGRSTEFEWGMPSDITDEVSVSLAGNMVRVKGFDYEQNALTDYNKFGHDAFEDGDYGYKLSIQISIQAGDTFGGNHIRTNVPETSRFLPSRPNEKTGLPDWEDNTELNPGGNEEISLFPLPHVDLQPTNPYEGIAEDIYIYAPQNADILNLVMDNNCNIFYDDPVYVASKMEYDVTVQDLNKAVEEYNSIWQEAEKNGMELTAEQSARCDELQAEISTLKATCNELTLAMQGCVRSTPDGRNNQFVDIHYTLEDPDGNTVGTMYIPHGKAYVNDNIAWDFSPMGGDTTIKKSGAYKVKINVEPVATTVSPNGYIYTDREISDNMSGPRYEYHSETYSTTGSWAEGTFAGSNIEKDAGAYLFQLKIQAVDTRLTPNQTVDVTMGLSSLEAMENVHILSYEWYCTDGITASLSENEPGITGKLSVGSGGVNLNSTIPDAVYEDGRVHYIGSILSCGEGAEYYIPVQSKLSRSCGQLDKFLDVEEQVEQTVRDLTDNDNIFGPGLHSVVWEHECDLVEDCDNNELNEAQGYNTAEAGSVEYLIHVQDNPKPTVEKSTSTPEINRGDEMKWKVTAENNTEAENPNHLKSEFTLIDIMPYNGDKLIDPLTNLEGSAFSGTLSCIGISLDLSGAPSIVDRLRSGQDKLYYTEDTSVRTAEEDPMLGKAESGNVNWVEAQVLINGDTVSVVGLPGNVQAVRLDTELGWGESVTMNLSGNVHDPKAQVMGDRYHNQARIYNGNGQRYSEVVAITFKPTFIKGNLWEDLDGNGLMDNGEPRFSGITVGLYRQMAAGSLNSPDIEINGLKLERAYNFDYDMIPKQVTDENGGYEFGEVNPGTYYILAEDLPGEFSIVRKNMSHGDISLTDLDSKCEERMVFISGANYAWITNVGLSERSLTGMNFGLERITGKVTVNKFLDKIYYPSGMTDEEKADYQLVFLFSLKNIKDGTTYKQTVRITAENMDKGTAECTFEDIPLGTYELTEAAEAQYSLDRFECNQNNAVFDNTAKKMTITITSTENEYSVTAYNKLHADPPGGDENGVSNMVNLRVPVSLKATYVGTDPISDASAVTYTMSYSDFDPAKGGDIVVTYDDGTQISLAAGTLRFEDVTINPKPITNMMNTKEGNKIAVTVFYSEKGRLVKDSFRVGVNLKPVHKFRLTFNANGSTFADGSVSNNVNFAYDEYAGYNVITGGTYKDVTNGGLKQYGTAPSYGFAGWNTKPDGTGTNYSSQAALNAIGQDPTISALTLYAQWTVSVTFDARGGLIQTAPGVSSGNLLPTEKDALNKGSATITWNLNQTIATNLAGNKESWKFVLWNTKADGSGTDLTAYGKITAPVTFYAVYYQTDFYYTGSQQTFTAPVDGIYKFEAYGSAGGYGNSIIHRPEYKAGAGGYAAGEITLKAGQQLYIYVGEQAPSTASYKTIFNGGGSSPRIPSWDPFFCSHPQCQGSPYCTIASHQANHTGGAGGGATDIRLIGGAWDNPQGLQSRIIVAGGGGGTVSVTCSVVGGVDAVPTSGHGGGLKGVDSMCRGYSDMTNYNVGYGGTQTSGGGHRLRPDDDGIDCTWRFGDGSFGKGGTSKAACTGGGGGGWYGGGCAYVTGGAGGSGYILGYPGCDTTYAAYQKSLMKTDPNIRNATMQTGVWDGQGYARVTLIQRQ